MSKLFQWPDWRKETVPQWQMGRLISYQSENSPSYREMWPEKWAMRAMFEQIQQWVSGRCSLTVTCIQRGRLVLGQMHIRCYYWHMRRGFGMGLGLGVVVGLSMATYVILPLWRTISWTPVREGHKQTWGRQNKKGGNKYTDDMIKWVNDYVKLVKIKQRK